MNRNQKIALGCGGAGCLGLIFLAVVGLGLYLYQRAPVRTVNVNTDYNSNRTTNSNSNSNSNNDNANSSTSTAGQMSNDDKHKLYQAAGTTGDADLIKRVSIKIGIINEDYSSTSEMNDFVNEHLNWALKNTDFIQSINSADKARAYVIEHIDD